MKKHKLITLLLICFFTNTHAQLQEIYTNNNQYINSMSFKNNKLLIGGKYGYIGQLNNTLDSIIELNTPIFPAAYTQIQQTDSNIIYAYSDQGNITLIYKSIDGGQTWIEKLNTDSVIDMTLTMLNKDEGILFCFQSTSLHTYDGGNTWERKYTGVYSPVIVGTYDSSICLGITYGFGTSTNSRQSWNFYNLNTQNTLGVQQIKYLNKETIISTCNAYDQAIYAFSEDEGQTFSKKYLPYTPYFLSTDLHFINLAKGYIVGTFDPTTPTGVIYKTTDTGTTWTSYNTYLPLMFTRIQLINDSIAIIGSSDGRVFKWNINTTPTSIKNNASETHFTVYPNPTQNTLFIQPNTNTQITNYKLYNTLGTLIKNEPLKNNKIDISNQPTGIYYLQLQTEKGNQTTKIIKE
jgi:photosystem II stability/assembly factor-like uncharacterized protein